MRVAELEGALLDYWVAKAEGLPLSCDWDQGDYILVGTGAGDLEEFSPSTDWAQGGPLLERALISVLYGPVDSIDEPGYWSAFIRPSDDDSIDGPTYLIAGMRAYVASKFGDEVEDIDAPQNAG